MPAQAARAAWRSRRPWPVPSAANRSVPSSNLVQALFDACGELSPRIAGFLTGFPVSVWLGLLALPLALNLLTFLALRRLRFRPSRALPDGSGSCGSSAVSRLFSGSRRLAAWASEVSPGRPKPGCNPLCSARSRRYCAVRSSGLSSSVRGRLCLLLALLFFFSHFRPPCYLSWQAEIAIVKTVVSTSARPLAISLPHVGHRQLRLSSSPAASRSPLSNSAAPFSVAVSRSTSALSRFTPCLLGPQFLLACLLLLLLQLEPFHRLLMLPARRASSAGPRRQYGSRTAPWLWVASALAISAICSGVGCSGGGWGRFS